MKNHWLQRREEKTVPNILDVFEQDVPTYIEIPEVPKFPDIKIDWAIPEPINLPQIIFWQPLIQSSDHWMTEKTLEIPRENATFAFQIYVCPITGIKHNLVAA